MLRTIILVIALVTLSAWATGAASAEEAFVAIDASLDAAPAPANAYADILEARLERVDGSMLRATLTLALLPETAPGMAYGVIVSDGIRSWYGALATIPHPVYLYGRWSGDSPGDSEETTGAVEVGAPGLIAIDIPVDGLAGALTLASIRGITVDLKGDLAPGPIPILMLDEVEAAGVFVVREPPTASGDATSGPASSGETRSSGSSTPPADTTSADLQPQGKRAQTSGPGVVGVLATLALAGVTATHRSR